MASDKPAKLNFFLRMLLDETEHGSVPLAGIKAIASGEPCAGVYPSTAERLKANIWLADRAGEALAGDVAEQQADAPDPSAYTKEERAAILEIRARALARRSRESRDA